MSLLQILIFPDSRLRKVASKVLKFDKKIEDLTKDLLETMYLYNGIGLAASQVNIHKRVIVMDISEEKKEPLILINPKITILNKKNKLQSEEGCLSVPGFYEEVERPTDVEVSFQDIKGKSALLRPKGLLSVVIQHETDHLDGRVFVDYLSNLKKEIIKKKLLKEQKEKKRKKK